jgi:DNA polymerase-3 subunit delta'
MARKAAPSLEEADRVDGFVHPRESFEFFGQNQALMLAARAIRGGRPPQALLLTGPPGVGKATLAYRVARYLLTYGGTAEGPEDLLVTDDAPASRHMLARAHPGLLVLTRTENEKTGKLMTVLGVDEMRRLTAFFGMSSGAGGWRVVIIDSADDMNDSAANALLKLLEEPPPNAMLLLISHRPGRLLPTIRSRCQRLDLRPLDEAALEQGLSRHLPQMPSDERAALARLAGGSLGAALTLASGDGAALAAEADRLIDQAATPDVLGLLALGEKLSRIRDGLGLFGVFLTGALAGRIRARALAGSKGLEPWVRLLTRLEQNFSRSTGLHLEPRQTVLSSARDLGGVAARQVF